MPPKRISAERIGKTPVHDHRLDGKAVGGDAIQQIADPLAAVVGEREALQMGVEVAAQVVDHALPDPDRRVIVQHGQHAGGEMNNDDAGAGNDQQHARRQRQQLPEEPAANRTARRWRLAAQHIVDDDLQGPGFEEFDPGDQEHLRQRPHDPPAVRLQVGQELADHRGVDAAMPCGSAVRPSRRAPSGRSSG